MATVDVLRAHQPTAEAVDTRTAFLVVDTESVPDGRLLAQVKYPGEALDPEAAIDRARAEAAANSWNKSDFLPVTFQVPVAVCVVRVGHDFRLQQITCLDFPLYRPREIVRKFWTGVGIYQKAKLVTFNGRGFDMPLLEMAAFRHGIPASEYFQKSRNRYNGPLDLMEFMNNFGACRMVGGLNLLAKLIGKPGKMDVAGDQVLRLFREGKHQQINDYCMCDTLDTYFVFLRTRVLTGDLTPQQEQDLVAEARQYLEAKVAELPALKDYLAGWTT